MTQFEISGTRYAITTEGPCIGWPCKETLVLWQISGAEVDDVRRVYGEAR